MVVSLYALAITIICSILWGVFDGIRKYLSSKAHLIVILFYLALGFSLFFFVWFLLSDKPQWNPEFFLPASLTVLFNAAANFYYIKAISVSPISNVVPFLAFTSLFTALTGFFFLGETLSMIQILGILLLVFASLLINGELNNEANIFVKLSLLWKSFLQEKGAHYMILVSLFWALSAPFDKIAVSILNVPAHGLFQSVLITIIYFFYLLWCRELKHLADFKKVKLSISLGALASCLALGLQFYAYQLMKVSVFESMKRAIALLTAIIISMIYFKEKISLLKTIGVILIITGASLILKL
jgi:drug/metabolite transporter (DMT)-like permease